MTTILRYAPLAAMLWSAAAQGQAPPSPPAPEPEPSGGATGVREADTSQPAPADQGPDTLPSLDEEPVPVEPVRPEPVRSAPRRRPRPLVRADRRLALLGELGWNGLAGFGVIVVFHAHPHVSFELGAGLAALGGKLGLRARYNVLSGPVTPFVGAGVIGATGWEAPAQELSADGDNEELNVRIRPSAFLQTVAGVDWTSRSGFTLVGALGYAFMLTRDNVVILTGVPTEEERRGLDIAFRSGVVISIALGYSFR